MTAARAAMLCALTLLAGGCGDEGEPATPGRACTEIGCGSGVIVELRGLDAGARRLVTVEACIGARCARSRQEPGLDHAFVELEPPAGDGPVAVRVTVTQRGRVIARAGGRAPVTKSRPNGDDCPPVCRQVLVSMRRGSDALEPTRA